MKLKGNLDGVIQYAFAKPDGEDVSLGLVNYASPDLKKIIGHHTDEIERILGYTFGDEVVHHNDMVLL